MQLHIEHVSDQNRDEAERLQGPTVVSSSSFVLLKDNKIEGFTLPNFKATRNKIAWSWQNKRNIVNWDRM